MGTEENIILEVFDILCEQAIDLSLIIASHCWQK